MGVFEPRARPWKFNTGETKTHVPGVEDVPAGKCKISLLTNLFMGSPCGFITVIYGCSIIKIDT